HYIDQTNKMDSLVVEAVPARTLRLLGVALTKHLSVIVQDVVFSWYKENLLVGSLQDLIHVVEFLRIGKMADVASMQDEFGLLGKRVDLVHGGFQGPDYIRICRFIESHVAVTDLHKTDPTHFVGLHLRAQLRSESVGLQHSTFNQAECTGAGPGHTFKKSTAIDSVVIVIVLDKPTGVRIKQFLFRHLRFLRLSECL